MTTMAHVSYPTLAFIGLSALTRHQVSNVELLTVMSASNLPDIDFLWQLIRKRKFDGSYTHHKWVTHWPITYLPLSIFTIFSPSIFLRLSIFGIYTHLFMDFFFNNQGIMPFYPFSKKSTSFFSTHFNGVHGYEWFKKYTELPIFKLDLIALSALVFFLSKRFL